MATVEPEFWDGAVDWKRICLQVMNWVERNFQLELSLNDAIFREVRLSTTYSLNQFGLPKPNIAKRAGVFTFWFRKLKPISYAENSPNYFSAINEMTALMTGLAICQTYKDDLVNPDFTVANIPRRLLFDWIYSLRRHSYSPHSLTMAFELIASKY
ncbi:hypothetical protein AGMMS49959_05940 [Planctomycetales bacterium]|nr:hypothetical protein AGMMS49959_05940 [Planctomycetales bacterium]